jgi:titin
MVLVAIATTVAWWAPVSPATAAGTIPARPRPPTAVPGDGSATVSWTAPADGGSPITGYVVTPITNAGAGPSQVFASTATTQVVTGLSNGVDHRFSVAAINANGTGPASGTGGSLGATRVGAPTAPPSATASPSSAGGTASLNWAAPASNGSAITGYRIVALLPAPNWLGPVREIGVASSLTFSMLPPGTYSFAVSARNARGYGPSTITGPVEVTSGAPSAAPQAVRASSRDGAVALSWAPPPSDPSVVVTRYRLVLTIDGVAGAPIELGNQLTTSRLAPNGSVVTFTVAAGSGAGFGPASPASDPVTVGTPSAPGVARATPGSGQATVSWTPPTNDRGSPVTGYEVTPIRAGIAQPAVPFASTATTQTIVGLDDGVAYSFAIAAVNARGVGERTTPGLLAQITVGAPVAPMGLHLVPGPRSLTATWTAPADNGSPISGYRLLLAPEGGSPLLSTPVTTSATSFTYADLTPGDRFEVFVLARNARGEGPAARSAMVTVPAGLPSAPRSPGAAAGDGSATVSWIPPAEGGGVPLVEYVVTPYVDGSPLAPQTVAAPATSMVVTGLANGVAHTFTVAARNENGLGPASPATAAVVIGVPDAPRVASVVPGDGAATIGWTQPDANGSPITSYVVTPYVGGLPRPSISVPAPDTTVTIAGLANGSTVTATVAAVSARGTGPASSRGTAYPSPVGSPLAPTDVVAGPGSASGSVAVSWTAAGDNGSPLSDHVVTLVRVGDPVFFYPVQVVVPAGQDAATITGLVPGWTYDVYVNGRNARGLGLPGRAGPIAPAA